MYVFSFAYIWLDIVFLVFSQFMCSHPNLSGKPENDGEIQIKCSSFTFPPIICDSDLEPAGWSWKEITKRIAEIVQILTSILFERVAKNHP